MRRTLSGAFSAIDLGGGVWLLSSGPSDPQVYLQGIRPDAPDLSQHARITCLCVEWRSDDAVVAVTGANGVRYLTTRSAIIHEPLPRLYESLPLAGFDADAKRFWKRVFRLMRIPGGRFLLGLLARRRRGTGKIATPIKDRSP